jgi:hypothetical protein
LAIFENLERMAPPTARLLTGSASRGLLVGVIFYWRDCGQREFDL